MSHKKKVGSAAWLGQVTEGIPEKKLEEFEGRLKKRDRGVGSQARGSQASLSGVGAGGQEEGGGVGADVGMQGEERQGAGVAVATAGAAMKRLRRAGFAISASGQHSGGAVGGGARVEEVCGPGAVEAGAVATGSVGEGSGREAAGGRGELHANAAERRREVEAERGVGDREKVARMEQQSRNRERMREAMFGKR